MLDTGHHSYQAVLAELSKAERLIMTTHENPDGDALGSLLAMGWGLKQLGKDAVMFMPASEFPLPEDYRFLGLDDIVASEPADIGGRVVVFLDCGNIDRMPVDALRANEAAILNIDHHHDNTCFGTFDLVDSSAACTAEIVYGLLSDLGATITPAIADALYVALITDTGKFMYDNTTASAHTMAAALIEKGVDVDAIFKRLYEDVPFAKLTLLARVLARVETYDDGKLVMARLLKEDYDYAEAEASFSEGIIDHLRAVRGTKVAALIRELLDSEPGKLKVSLRATDDEVDVSAIARAAGGGGHRRAAGFTSVAAVDRLIKFLREQVQTQLGS